ncbi:MAG: type II secretion system protein [Microgenomates group bacterium]
MKKGFTLVEMLVVIVVMGILAALISTNLYGARTRATDSQRKTTLNQLKIALHSYYATYHKYPLWTNGLTFNACGVGGTSSCTTSFTADGVEYLNKLPKSGSYFDFRYYSCLNEDDFRLKISLNNASDPDIAISKARCPEGCNTTYSANTYVLCAN